MERVKLQNKKRRQGHEPRGSAGLTVWGTADRQTLASAPSTATHSPESTCDVTVSGRCGFREVAKSAFK
jgi:hypothetical protein